MKIVIIGGTGVFGQRLAELAERDGCEVVVAVRRPKDIKHLKLDREGDLSPLLTVGATLVVDAAGPFQSYGTDPYRLVRFCLENGLDYFDLSDDAAFCQGISQFDQQARALKRVILTGVSTVPALSGAVVTELTAGLCDLRLFDIAILPGNRAPRGRSVVAAILAQVGQPLRIWRAGAWQDVRAWSSPQKYRLGTNDWRIGRLVGAPDLQLFPAIWPVRSVLFRAGLELNGLNLLLTFYGWLHRHRIIGPSEGIIRLSQWFAQLWQNKGTDYGGMIVTVTGRQAHGALFTRRWQLRALSGDGPYVPTIPGRALIRRWQRISPGARVAYKDLKLSEIEAALSDLALTHQTDEGEADFLFKQALVNRWPQLPEVVRRLHEISDYEVFTGQAEVVRGRHPLAKLLAGLFRFPPENPKIEVTVRKWRTIRGETWERQFGEARFRSHLSQARGQGRVWECFGPFAFELELGVSEAGHDLRVRRGRFFGLPLPSWLLPISRACESVKDGRFHFDVALIAPLGVGLIVHYRGWLEVLNEPK